ncbi:MAG: RNase adapter RapZ, partial [Deltaproteobacteria bacterium]
LFRRYKETRRLHPLNREDPRAGIEKEREILFQLRKTSHQVIDTSSLTPHELREIVQKQFIDGDSKRGLNINIVSFGYRYGNPTDADLVIVVRFLPNPYFIEKLKPLSGLRAEVKDFVLEKELTGKFLSRLREFLNFLLPNYVSEGRALLTIGIGCTGGMHRSVVIAQELHKILQGEGNYTVKVEHRDIKET